MSSRNNASKSKVKKENTKKIGENLTPVFQFKPTFDDRVLCKWIGNITNKDKLHDDVMELDKEYQESLTNALGFSELRGYSIHIKLCDCNIAADFLIKKDKDTEKLVINNRKIPVYYTTIMYANQLVSGMLVTIYLYFTLDDKTVEKIESSGPKKLVNAQLTGKYSIEFVTDEGILSKIIEKSPPFIEEKGMIAYADRFEDMTDEKKATMFEKLEKLVEETHNNYRKIFEAEDIKFTPSKKKFVKLMTDKFKLPGFKDVLKYSLQFREDDRKEKMCPDQDYTAPKRVINLEEFRDDPKKLDEYIDNLSNATSDSDE